MDDVGCGSVGGLAIGHMDDVGGVVLWGVWPSGIWMMLVCSSGGVWPWGIWMMWGVVLRVCGHQAYG